MRKITIAFCTAFFSLTTSVFAERFTILHTNDWQSRLLGFSPESEYKPAQTGDGTIGGVARLATLIDEKRKAASNIGPVFLFDAGDFTMGTLFHTVARETGYEIQLLKMLGYDAVSLGNHEFDFRVTGLSSMIEAARKKQGSLPPILATNLNFSNDPDGKDKALKKLADEGVIKKFEIFQRGSLKIGVFGILGTDAVEVAVDTKPLVFENTITASQKMIDHLRNQEKVDVVIMLSHSGVRKKEDGGWGGEEVDFAQKLKGLDIIVGGHSHTPLFDPIVINNVPILQAGSEARFLGELTVDVKDGKVAVEKYQLHAVNDQILGKPDVTEKIEEAKKEVTEKILQPLGFTFDQPLAQTKEPHTFEMSSHLLGTMTAEALRVSANAQIGFMANGNIRDHLLPGKTGMQTVSDLFRILPLGIGLLDDEPGYPVIKMYLTPHELKQVFEILLIAYRMKGRDFYPRFSNVKIYYNTMRVPLDQVYAAELQNDKGEFISLDLSDKKSLVSVGTTSYIGSFMWMIKKMSYGIYEVKPKNEKGEVFQDIKEAIVDRLPNKEGVQEYKSWLAFLNYVRSLKDVDGDGIPDIPSEVPNPMMATSSLNPASLYANAGMLQWGVSALGLCAIGIFAGLWRRRSKRL